MLLYHKKAPWHRGAGRELTFVRVSHVRAPRLKYTLGVSPFLGLEYFYVLPLAYRLPGTATKAFDLGCHSLLRLQPGLSRLGGLIRRPDSAMSGYFFHEKIEHGQRLNARHASSNRPEPIILLPAVFV